MVQGQLQEMYCVSTVSWNSIPKIQGFRICFTASFSSWGDYNNLKMEERQTTTNQWKGNRNTVEGSRKHSDFFFFFFNCYRRIERITEFLSSSTNNPFQDKARQHYGFLICFLIRWRTKSVCLTIDSQGWKEHSAEKESIQKKQINCFNWYWPWRMGLAQQSLTTERENLEFSLSI